MLSANSTSRTGIYATLSDIINRNDRYDINKITFFTQTDDKTLIIPDHNLFETYMRFVRPFVGTYSVTDAERRYYRYRPYLLALDVYGTHALGWLILMLNDRECASKFYLKSTVHLIPVEYLNNVYDTIVTKSNTRLKQNWNTYLRKVGVDVSEQK